MADIHLTQLTFQHNDVFRDEEDMRDKYVARHLFRRLAREGRLTSPADVNEPPQFRIFSEDLRPSNVLIDADDRVVSVCYRLGIRLRGPVAVLLRPAVVATPHFG